jgi:hypothetical protein
MHRISSTTHRDVILTSYPRLQTSALRAPFSFSSSRLGAREDVVAVPEPGSAPEGFVGRECEESDSGSDLFEDGLRAPEAYRGGTSAGALSPLRARVESSWSDRVPTRSP